MSSSPAGRLPAVLRRAPVVMEALRVARDVELEDLFACVCRHNPARVPAGFYERRVAEKAWRDRWPRMRYVRPAGGERPSDPTPTL